MFLKNKEATASNNLTNPFDLVDKDSLRNLFRFFCFKDLKNLSATCKRFAFTAREEAQSRRCAPRDYSHENSHLINKASIEVLKRNLCSPDDRYIGIPHEENNIKIIDMHSGEMFRELRRDKPGFDWVQDVEFSKDGTQIMARDIIFIYIWEAENGKLLHTLRHSTEIYSAVYSAQADYIVATSKDKVTLWCTKKGERIQHYTHKNVNDAVVSPNGKYILSSARGDTALLFEIESCKPYSISISSGTQPCFNISFSPDSQYFAIIKGAHKGVIGIYETETQKLVNKYKSVQSLITCLYFSPDGKYIACGGEHNLLEIWDVNSPRSKKIFLCGDVRGQSTFSANFSPDSRHVVTASSGGNIIIWDINAERKVHEIRVENAGKRIIPFFTHTGNLVYFNKNTSSLHLITFDQHQFKLSI